jgi:7-keto-8-aminopelargonate synthetase-like enzyme
LEAISTVIDILASDEYAVLRSQLDRNIEQMVSGLREQDLVVLGGKSPIISVLVGDEEATFLAAKLLFDRGYYVQSVTFPAVRYHAGVLRIQVNSNHSAAAIDGLLAAVCEVCQVVELPRTVTMELSAA